MTRHRTEPSEGQKKLFQAAEYIKNLGFKHEEGGGFLLLAWNGEHHNKKKYPDGREMTPIRGGALLEGDATAMVSTLDALLQTRPDILDLLLEMRKRNAIGKPTCIQKAKI